MKIIEFANDVDIQKRWLITITLLHSEQPKLYGVLAVLSAIGLRVRTGKSIMLYYLSWGWEWSEDYVFFFCCCCHTFLTCSLIE